MLELKNPEKFKVEWAMIVDNHLRYQLKGGYSPSDYFIKSERGGKLIFSREFGKGAKWGELV